MSSSRFPNYSVLMSVYYKEKAEYLRQSVQSMLEQTVPTNDFVIVCDGPLTDELEETVSTYQNQIPDVFHIIRLPQNEGLGNALNKGLRYCKNELIARMDSDDIAVRNRCQKQLAIFEQDNEIDIVSGTIQEFKNSINDTQIFRRVPQTHKEILAFAAKRNPFNHPCVMYKKSAVQKAGGYQHFYLLEDYYLWLRVLKTGGEGYNIPDVLLYMRAGSKMIKRRGGFRYACSQVHLMQYAYKNGLLTLAQMIKNSTIRFCGALLPNKLREFIYLLFFRSKNYNDNCYR